MGPVELRGKVIFHERNGQVLMDSDEARRLMDCQGGAVATFKSDYNSYGHFKNTIYSTIGGLLIYSEWTPNRGYSWEETKIIFIPIPQ